MKQHNFNLLLTVLFCLFIGGMFLGSILLPDRTFSQLENRNLSWAVYSCRTAPFPSWKTEIWRRPQSSPGKLSPPAPSWKMPRTM